MPNYNSRNISGHAAEYLVAYIVTHKLGWPFRLLDVDIGVDGELEILDERGNSNGDVIKVQVKAVARMRRGGTHVYVKEDRVKYWKGFSSPVVVCCVDHSSASVRWQPVYRTEDYPSSGRSRCFTFETDAPLLDASSKDALRRLVTPAEVRDFSKGIDELAVYLAKWENVYSITFGFGDGERQNEVYREIAQIKELVERLDAGRKRFPWCFSPSDHALLDGADEQVRWVKRTADQASAEAHY